MGKYACILITEIRGVEILLENSFMKMPLIRKPEKGRMVIDNLDRDLNLNGWGKSMSCP